MNSFEGKNVWIIGASSGIGRALALAIHQRGAKLVLSARSTEKLLALNAEMEDKHEVCPIDVADSEAVAMLAKDLKKNSKK